jgi:pimeloyl-ACP methyl ester carboxylesterase
LPGRGEVFVRRTDSTADTVPVLLLHGWQATADMNFFPLFEPLGQRHLVVAPDLRGHGRSLYPEEPFTIEAAADDAAALLAELDLPSAIVLGYSLGTAVAQMMVARHRSAVAGVVLMGGEFAPDRRPHEKVYDRLGGWMATGQRLSNGRWGAHRIVSKAARENPAVEELRGWLVTEMERGHTASLRAAGRALARFDGRPIAAANNDVPVAVVVTERDRLVRPSRQRDLAAAWAAKEISLDADHDAPVARPAEFVDAALAAVAAVAAAEVAAG